MVENNHSLGCIKSNLPSSNLIGNHQPFFSRSDEQPPASCISLILQTSLSILRCNIGLLIFENWFKDSKLISKKLVLMESWLSYRNQQGKTLCLIRIWFSFWCNHRAWQSSGMLPGVGQQNRSLVQNVTFHARQSKGPLKVYQSAPLATCVGGGGAALCQTPRWSVRWCKAFLQSCLVITHMDNGLSWINSGRSPHIFGG